jgi:hypothetical protein
LRIFSFIGRKRRASQDKFGNFLYLSFAMRKRTTARRSGSAGLPELRYFTDV